MSAVLENSMLSAKPAMPTRPGPSDWELGERIATMEHWFEHQLTKDEAQQLARVMENIERATDGDLIAKQAVLSAVWKWRQWAMAEAREDV